MQLVLSSAARAVTKTPKFHIQLILKSLHWLNINARIQYKVLSHTKHLAQIDLHYLHLSLLCTLRVQLALFLLSL